MLRKRTRVLLQYLYDSPEREATFDELMYALKDAGLPASKSYCQELLGELCRVRLVYRIPAVGNGFAFYRLLTAGLDYFDLSEESSDG